jgi:maltose/moltooligosaccharide transporter
MRGEESTLVADAVSVREPGAENASEIIEALHIPPLSLAQSLLYGSGGIAGGLVFTMMNNALPLFLLTYTMPLGLPVFLNPGGAIPATLVALLANERSLFGGLIQPLVGHLSDKTRSPIGRRGPYLVAGALGTAASIAALAFHPPFWLMIMAVTLSGVALYVGVGPYTTLLADITPFSQRGRVGGLMAIFGVVGAITFSVLSIVLWDAARDWVFLITAGLVGLSMLLVAFGVHEPKSTYAHSAEEHHRIPVLRGLLADRALATYVAAMAIYWLGAGAAAPFITRFGVVELGLQSHEAFIMLLVVVLATSVGAIIAGLLADKVGRKRVLQPALVLFAVAAVAGSQVQGVAQALPVMLLVGLGNAAPTALYLPLLADLVPRSRAGAYMGYASLVWSVAQPLGSLLAGLLVDATDSYRGIFIFAGVCMLVASFLMRKVPSHQREQQRGAS